MWHPPSAPSCRHHYGGGGGGGDEDDNEFGDGDEDDDDDDGNDNEGWTTSFNLKVRKDMLKDNSYCTQPVFILVIMDYDDGDDCDDYHQSL